MEDGLFAADDGGAADLTAQARTTSGAKPQLPLAVRMRPQSLDEIVGQQHLLGERAPLRRLIAGSGAASVMLYGPPGTGKTTMAS